MRGKSLNLPIESFNNPDINDDYPYTNIIDNNQSLKQGVFNSGFIPELRSF